MQLGIAVGNPFAKKRTQPLGLLAKSNKHRNARQQLDKLISFQSQRVGDLEHPFLILKETLKLIFKQLCNM